MEKRKAKQTQWGITLLLGVFILAGTVGHIESGGAILPGLIKMIIGTVVSIWGLVKTIQWTPLGE